MAKTRPYQIRNSQDSGTASWIVKGAVIQKPDMSFAQKTSLPNFQYVLERIRFRHHAIYRVALRSVLQ